MKHDRRKIKCSVTERKQKAKAVTHPVVVLLPKKITITTLHALKVSISINAQHCSCFEHCKL